MKTNCAKCEYRFDVSDGAILDYIEHNPNFRRKCAALLGRMNAIHQSNQMTPAQRSERARLAVAAREAKRQARTGTGQE